MRRVLGKGSSGGRLGVTASGSGRIERSVWWFSMRMEISLLAVFYQIPSSRVFPMQLGIEQKGCFFVTLRVAGL